MKRERPVWYGAGVLPVRYAIVFTPQGWQAGHDRWGQDLVAPFPTKGARTAWFAAVDGEGALMLVAVSENTQKSLVDEPVLRAALVAHEAVHVAQYAAEWMAETAPGNEIFAYMVQSIVMDLLAEWENGVVST